MTPGTRQFAFYMAKLYDIQIMYEIFHEEDEELQKKRIAILTEKMKHYLKLSNNYEDSMEYSNNQNYHIK